LKLNESEQSKGIYALRVRVFEAQIEGFPQNPKCPLWVDSCHSAIARQSLIKRLLHPRGTPHLFYLVPSRTITYYSGRMVRYILEVTMKLLGYDSRTSDILTIR